MLVGMWPRSQLPRCTGRPCAPFLIHPTPPRTTPPHTLSSFLPCFPAPPPRARRKTVTEKDFLEAVNKVIKGYQKFSATPKYMVYN